MLFIGYINKLLIAYCAHTCTYTCSTYMCMQPLQHLLLGRLVQVYIEGGCAVAIVHGTIITTCILH